MSLQTSPTSPAVTSQTNKDAQFLLELFRESPNPIHINIGPYAAKTGAKPNTIIKRLAGIKQRNRLNIKTTQGEHRPSAGSRPIKAPKLKAELPPSPETAETKPAFLQPSPQPQFKPESPPSSAYSSFSVKVEPQCPLTPVSSRTHSVFGIEDGMTGSSSSSSSSASSFAVMERELPRTPCLKRQQRDWDQELMY